MSLDALPGLFVQYGYWIVFTAILLDTAGLPIPGELLLLLLGAAARAGDLDLGLGLLVAAAAALSGDTVGYWLGRMTGDRVLRTYCQITLGSGTCVRRAMSFYERYGIATVVVGRFVPGVRAFLSPLAGSAGMPFHRFLLFDGLGSLLWSALFLGLGYSFGWRLGALRDGYHAGSTALLSVVGAGAGTYVLIKLFHRWRHGAPSLHEGLVARVAGALRRRRRERTLSTSRPETTVASDDPPNRRLALPAISPEVDPPSTLAMEAGPRPCRIR